ncbi:AMP deaminase [Auricularia subglabra TFB-10046 SS5]|nr:AMP deaminase [Auricularia subglabra TFB-10046 SS5]
MATSSEMGHDVADTPTAVTPPATMLAHDAQSPTPGGEHVAVALSPDATRDAFFDYTQEKTLKSIEEKYWAHRRQSGGAGAQERPAPLTTAPSVRTSPLLQPGHPAGSVTMSPLDPHASANLPQLPAEEILKLPAPAMTMVDGEKMAFPDVSISSSNTRPVNGPLGTALNAAELVAEDGEETLQPHGKMAAEHAPDGVCATLQRCLDLRDRYISASLQRLGDNPRDYDGSWDGFADPSYGDVVGARPDAPMECEKEEGTSSLKPWRIYPKPPPPHWHWTPRPDEDEEEEFDFAKCDVPGSDPNGWVYRLDERGVYQVYDGTSPTEAGQKPLFDIPTLREYYVDLDFVLNVISDGPTKSFCFRQLKYLQSKWTMYSLLNEHEEMAAMKRVPHRDLYNVRKVDTHVHHSSSMNQKHLLRFIKSKMKRSPDDVVIFRDGAELTLEQVFQSLNLTAYDLSIDTLDMHAHQEFHRFDKFNLKYNPIGESRLREIFLKTDNFIQGRYLAELTKEVMTDLEQSKYQNCEWRISIYGRSESEWDKLAKWIVNNKLYSHNVRWLVQIPRLYDVYKENGSINNFQDIIKNLFNPLFEATHNPSSHPELFIFLQRVIGIDCVDDESKPERRLYRKFPYPPNWDTRQNPPYSYWIYYLYANIASLNQWRRARGFNTFVLRPHSGEAGDTDHLASAYLTSHSISHGILLRKVPALQYLFYLKQIGLAMSPLSNNALFLTYERNPLPDFFRVGLNVSLSTDDPLQFHFTKEPLLEEYSVAAHIYKFSQASLAELARNSVIQSGFEMQVKRHWIGLKWYLPGAAGNDINKTNVPNIRLAFRHQTLLEELQMIRHGALGGSSGAAPGGMPGAAAGSSSAGAPSGMGPMGMQSMMSANTQMT